MDNTRDRLDRMDLEAALGFDRPMTPDERLSRALTITGLMNWQIRRATRDGATVKAPRRERAA